MDLSLLNNPKSSFIILLVTVLWILPWKIYSLWTASKRGDKIWFIVLIIVNTVGILDIIYVFAIAKKKWPEIKSSFLQLMSSKK